MSEASDSVASSSSMSSMSRELPGQPRSWMARWRASLKRFAPLLPLVLATALLARALVRAILTKVGHPGAALDDAYIHFQYARAIAELHPFRFQAGEPISTGATSFLWPALLSIPYALGLRGESILWAAWSLSFLALGGLAYEAYALTRALAGRAAAIGAGAMTLAFGGLAWCAASGMEVVPFAWILAHGARRASEWVENAERRKARELRVLVALAFVAPLVRPEGALVPVLFAVAVALRPPALETRSAHEPDVVPASAWAHVRARAVVGLLVVAALAPHLILIAMTGSATSSTARVKLLFGNPYYDVASAAWSNARLLVGTLLDGEVWSAEFLPRGGAAAACAGLVAIAWRGRESRRFFRAGAVIVLALAIFAPCFYVTFLWNRLRYLWPFASAWFVGLACLAQTIGAIVGRLDRRAAPATTTLVAGAFVGALATHLDWVIDDVAQSASGIGRQQVALGHWADAHLPKDARIGVNDTGAIAYFGNRRTFDIVGLTTPGEGKYWVAGPASRLEHYERLAATSPGALPSHFIVYPEWMACDAVLGRPLYEATVTDASILGGQTMRVYEARWQHLGTGERPWTIGIDDAHRSNATSGARVVDDIDVADLESEAAHAYDLLGARDGEQIAEEGNAPDGSVVLDGGRTQRTRDRFFARLTPERGARLVGRVRSDEPLVFHLALDGREVSTTTLTPGPWSEISFDLPATPAGDGTQNPAPTQTPTQMQTPTKIEVSADGATFTSFHWWIIDR